MPDPFVPGLPAIQSLGYLVAGLAPVITVSMDSLPPQNGVTAALFQGTPTGIGWLASSKTTGQSMTIIPPAQLTPGTTYMVALTLTPTGTPTWGTPATLVFQPPTPTNAAIVDGGVEVGWTLPAPTSITAVNVQLSNQVNGTTVVSGTFNGTGARLVPTPPLAPNGQYAITVKGVNGVASGPLVSLQQNLILSSPAIASAVYAVDASGAYSVTVTPQTVASPPGTVTACLLCAGRIVARQPASGTSAVIPLGGPLDPACRWQIQLLYSTGTVSGPTGVATDIPTQQLQITSASYDGTQFHVAWAMPSGGVGATGGDVIVRRTSNKRTVASATVNPGFSADFNSSATLQPTDSYEIVVAPVLGNIHGLYGPGLPLIVTAPTLTSVASTDEQVIVKMQGASATASGTLLLLSSGGDVIMVTPGGLAGGFLTLPPDGLPNLSISVRAVAGKVSGPASSPAVILSAIPVLTEISFVGGTITGKATVPGNLPLDTSNVEVSLYGGGIAIGVPVQAQTDGSFSVQPDGQALAALTLRASIVGSARGVTVVGPLSPPAPVLTAAPQVTGAWLTFTPGPGSQSQWQVEAEWSLPEGNTTDSFVVEFQQGETTVKTWAVQGFVLRQTAPPFTASQPVTLKITPQGNFGTGIPSSVTFLATPPVISSALCETDTITAQWSAPAEADPDASPTGYRLRLVQSTAQGWSTVSQSEPLEGTLAALSLPGTQVMGVSYGLTVDVAIASAWTAANSVTPIVVQTPLLNGMVGATGTQGNVGACTLSWEWPGGAPPTSPGLTGYNIVSVQDGHELLLKAQPAPASSATVQLTNQPVPGTRLALRPVAGSVVGPRSAALSILISKAASLSASADADGILVDFAPSPPPTRQYAVTLLAGGNPVTLTWVAAPPARLSFNGALPGTAYSLKVTPVSEDGLSTGPDSDALPVMLVAPTISTLTTEGTSLSIGVAAPDAGGIAAGSYLVDLLREGIPVQRLSGVVPLDGKLSIPISQTHDPAGRYSVQVYPVAGNATGLSAKADVLLAAPTVAGATVLVGNGSSNVNVLVQRGTLAGDALKFEAVLIADGVMGTPVAVSQGQATLPVPTGAKVCLVAARASLLTATGPWSPGVAVPVVPPVVSATYDGRSLACAWTGDANAGYRVQVVKAGGDVAVETVAQGLSTILTFAADVGEVYLARVIELAGVAVGPTGTLALVTDGCPITSAATDANGSVIVKWQSPAAPASGISGFQPVVVWNGTETALPTQPPGTTQATLPLPANIPSGAAIAIRALAGTSTGPRGGAASILLGLPVNLSVKWDGQKLTATWGAVADERVDGYIVTLAVNGSESQVQRVTGTQFQIAFAQPTDPNASASVFVSAADGASSGPATSPVPVFASGLYLSTDTNPPYLAPAITPARAPYDIVLYLPQIFSTPPQTTQLPSAAPFALAPTTTTPFKYTLTIAATGIAWTFTSDTVRDNLQTAYTAFLSTLESLTATPLGIRTVRDAISRVMPQRFAETLYYAYGFSPEQGYIDLVPGMILRAEYEAYQYPGAHVTDAAFLAGFVTAAVAEYEVASYVSSGNRYTGLNTFLARIAAAQGVSVPAMSPDPTGRAMGAGGIFDAFFTQFQQPYCRLVYPPGILKQDSAGSPFPYKNPMLLGASNLSDLKTATDNVRNSITPGGSIASFYFRGRVTLSALIRVVVNGVPAVVPVGTTVGNILASLGARPPAAGLPLSGITLTRPRATAITDSSVAQSGYPVGEGWSIRLDWSTGTTDGTTGDRLELPVLHGDQLDFDSPATS
jgi:hypothetical protein